MDFINTTPSSHWKANLRKGHIVSFKFPHERPGGDDPKSRTSLVMCVTRSNDIELALLAYGTTKVGYSAPRKDLIIRINGNRDIAMASLKEETMFTARRWIVVPLDDPRFCFKDDTAIIGRLPSSYMGRFNFVRGRLLEDIRRQALPEGATLGMPVL
ncbi:MAG: hypothetical protein ACKVLA_02485 [Rhodobacterales bacterium]